MDVLKFHSRSGCAGIAHLAMLLLVFGVRLNLRVCKAILLKPKSPNYGLIDWCSANFIVDSLELIIYSFGIFLNGSFYTKKAAETWIYEIFNFGFSPYLYKQFFHKAWH